MSEIALEVKNLKKVYGRGSKSNTALKDVSFSVETGQICGFIGINGAGKSTAIRMLTGLSRPTEGQALLFGRDAMLPEARERIGYCPESPYLLDSLTPTDWLMINARLKKLNPQYIKKEIAENLEKFGIGHVADKPIRKFSKGMTQRVALANALLGKPELLILDEPLSGLDPLGRKQVLEILREYAQAGGTVFFSSHILSDIESLVDKFIWIHQGKIRDMTDQENHIFHMYVVEWKCNENFGVGEKKSDSNLWKAKVSIDRIKGLISNIDMHHGELLRIKEDTKRLEEIFIQTAMPGEEKT